MVWGSFINGVSFDRSFTKPCVGIARKGESKTYFILGVVNSIWLSLILIVFLSIKLYRNCILDILKYVFLGVPLIYS